MLKTQFTVENVKAYIENHESFELIDDFVYKFEHDLIVACVKFIDSMCGVPEGWNQYVRFDLKYVPKIGRYIVYANVNDIVIDQFECN